MTASFMGVLLLARTAMAEVKSALRQAMVGIDGARSRPASLVRAVDGPDV
jgi:hypothetical protein